MKKKLTFNTAITGIVLASLFGCNNNNTATDSGGKGNDTTKVATTNSNDDLLPNLLQIGSIIKYSGLTYIPGVTSPVDASKQYNNGFDRNLNMGVDFADLAYCTLNKQSQDAVNYLKEIKAISDEIGLSQIFGANSFQRFQDNVNNEDSLTALVADMQLKTDDILKANKQNNFRVIIYSGAWIENMYIGSKAYAKSNDSNAGGHVIEEMNLLENMMKVLHDYKGTDAQMVGLYNDLKNADDTYKGFEEGKNYNPDSKKPFAFTEEHVKKFTGILEGLHSKYVK